MKKILILLSLISITLFADPSDYSYKLLDVKENLDKNNALTSVTVRVFCELGGDFIYYSPDLDSKQFTLYKADVNNFNSICEDIFAVAKAKLDDQIKNKPKAVAYDDTKKEAVPIDKTAIDTKAQNVVIVDGIITSKP